MPIKKSKSKEAMSENIALLLREGKPREQAVAIALDVAREAGANIPKPKSKKNNPNNKKMHSREESVESVLAFLREGEKAPLPKKKKEDEDELGFIGPLSSPQ